MIDYFLLYGGGYPPFHGTVAQLVVAARWPGAVVGSIPAGSMWRLQTWPLPPLKLGRRRESPQAGAAIPL